MDQLPHVRGVEFTADDVTVFRALPDFEQMPAWPEHPDPQDVEVIMRWLSRQLEAVSASLTRLEAIAPLVEDAHTTALDAAKEVHSAEPRATDRDRKARMDTRDLRELVARAKGLRKSYAARSEILREQMQHARTMAVDARHALQNA